MKANPLLDFDGLPRFDAIRPEQVTPAIDALLADARAAAAGAPLAPMLRSAGKPSSSRSMRPPIGWDGPGARLRT